MSNTATQGIFVGERQGSIPRVDLFILGLLILTVVVLSFTVFSKESLRLDEAQSLWQTSHSPMGILQIVAEDVHVPLYHMMLHYWQVFFGNSVATARMLSLIFFLAAIPSIYKLGSFVYNRNVGLFAAILLAISPFLNWYGNEIRMYSLFILITIWNMYFFMRIFHYRESSLSNGEGKASMWVGYTITVILGMFTHYFFAFNLITQAIFFIAFRKNFPARSLQSFITVALLMAIVYAPWVYYVITLGSASNMQPMLLKPTTVDLFNTFSQFIFGFQDDHINTILVSLWPILVLLIFLSLRQNHRVTPPTTFLFMSLFLPILMAFTISNTVRPIYLTRYLILTLPALYMLISWVLYVYPRRLSVTLRTVVVVGMAVMLMVEIVNANTPVKENYRAAAEYLSRYAAAQDIIVVSAPFTVYPVEYYYNGPAEISTLPLWDRRERGRIPPFDETKLAGEVDQLKTNHEILWLLQSYDQGYEEKIRLHFDTRFERLVAIKFSPELNLYAYRLHYNNQYKPTFPIPEQGSNRFDINWREPFDSVRKQLRGIE